MRSPPRHKPSSCQAGNPKRRSEVNSDSGTATTVFGIDLGTTYSCIAKVDESGRPVVLQNFEGDMTTPSVVLFEGSNRVVGKQAKNQAVLQPEDVAEFVKQQMGTDWRFP